MMKNTGNNTMLSRVADSLYWMSRYLERAEHTARLMDVDLQLQLDQSGETGSDHWRRLVKAARVPIAEIEAMDSAALPHALTLYPQTPSSIVSSVTAAPDNLRH